MISIMQVAAVLVGLAIAGVLIWRFLATRNPGCLILTLAIPLWSVVGFVINPLAESQLDRMRAGRPPSFPYSLLGEATTMGTVSAVTIIGLHLLQSLLILTGFLVLALYRGTRSQTAHPSNDLEPTNGPA